MGVIRNLLNSRVVRNAVQQRDGFKGYNSSQLNNYNGYQTDIYTTDYMGFLKGTNRAGEYDNYYGDYNRIIQVAPTYPLYYVRNDEVVDTGAIAEYLKTPNDTYPQYKVLQQIYSQMVTQGYSDIFLWRKDGSKETNLFEYGKRYNEDQFRGITLVSGYYKLSENEKKNIIRLQYGASQTNVFMGYSPSQAANSWRRMQDEMGLHMTAFAKNAGMPIGQWIITAEKPEDYVKIRNKLEEKTAGARNNGKQLYSYRPSGAKESQIHWVQFTSQDVQDYTTQLEFSEKKMSQSFGVPGTVKGTNDGENYATARVSEHIFIKYTIKPLVEDMLSQLYHAVNKRFEISGEIKVDIQLPEIADESRVRIETTSLQVKLFDRKVAEGYTPASIVKAYGLPESFLLLEMDEDSSSEEQSDGEAPEEQEEAENSVHNSHNHGLVTNALTLQERADIEAKFREAAREYADDIIDRGITQEAVDTFKGRMVATFSEEYAILYDKTVEEVAEALTDVLDVVDVSDLRLTDEQLEEAVARYNERVDDFSQTFANDIAALPGETLEVRKRSAEPNIERVAVTETEHSRIVSELGAWTKAQEDFPVRIYKTWTARADACDECRELNDVQIDVTALFVGRNDPGFSEIYEVQGGGLHPACKCSVRYEVERES